MITVKTFVFNPFQVNTYLLYDETNECIIIDPGCLEDYEKKEISDFIISQKLRPVRLFDTHPHIDHIAGNKFIADTYGLKLEVHKDSLQLLRSAKGFAVAFGIENIEPQEPAGYIAEGDLIKFGNSEIKVLYTPGHADGSVCFYSEKNKLVIVGDVLFNEGIGRTDFPTGNHEALIKNIKTKLFTLPDDTEVYPGHGPSTTIGWEKENNPFLN
jgi:glyoxylase-like metal-dependent hydrolase (beta-lactamase superfamily II)